MLVPALERWSDRVRQTYAQQDFESLLQHIERGPAVVSPWRWPGVENAVNLLEYFVHTEDVRRAAPSWSPRALEAEHEEAIWHQLTRQARLAFRPEPGGVELRTPDGARSHLVRRRPAAVVVGEVAELVMYAFGRRDHALVSRSDPSG